MTVVPINEARDQLSRLIAEVERTGNEIEISRHDKVVARLVPARPTGVVFGVDARPGVRGPELEDLAWTDEELDEMFGPGNW